MTDVGDRSAGKFIEDFGKNASQGALCPNGGVCGDDYSDNGYLIDSADEEANNGQGYCSKPVIDKKTGEEIYYACNPETGGKAGTAGIIPNFNLCQPDFRVVQQIGLGLGEQTQPTETPSCTFTKMKENWEEELRKSGFFKQFWRLF